MNSNGSKKDLFSTNSLAANFLGKIEKFRKQANGSTTSETPSQTTTNSLLNFGLSFHKKVNDDETITDDCVVVTNC